MHSSRLPIAIAILLAFLIPMSGLVYFWQRLKITETQAAMFANRIGDLETQLAGMAGLTGRMEATEARASALVGTLEKLESVVGIRADLPEGTIGLGNGLQHVKGGPQTQGQWNTAVGMNALLESTSGWAQTAVGFNALRDSGVQAGPVNTGVFGNTAVGYNSMVVNHQGFDNTAIGTNTLLNNRDGYDNAAVGINALRDNRTGAENTAIGFDALMYTSEGSQNVALGGMAGRFLADGATPKAGGHRSIYIGYRASGGEADGAENEIVVGAGAEGAGSHTMVFGNQDIKTTVLRGQLRIDRPEEKSIAPNLAFDVETGAIVIVRQAVD